MSVKEAAFNIPPPDLQIGFSDLLVTARGQFLQQALLSTVKDLDIAQIDQEIREYAPKDRVQVLAGCGLRAEMVFCLPTILRAQPRLLGYYRLLLGFSRKAFYTKEFGLGPMMYPNMEDENNLSEAASASLPNLCRAPNGSANYLINEIPRRHITPQHLEALTLLTYGTQLRGSANVAIGQHAIRQVFDAIKEIVGPNATRIEDNLIAIEDATGRDITIRFSSDPDIEVVTVRQQDSFYAPILAIEIKGGTDFSNIHNRLGEAEKSHLRARERGFTDLWTIFNVRNLSDRVLRMTSPTTTAFFNLRDLVAAEGEEYNRFRVALLEKLRLRDPEKL